MHVFDQHSQTFSFCRWNYSIDSNDAVAISWKYNERAIRSCTTWMGCCTLPTGKTITCTTCRTHNSYRHSNNWPSHWPNQKKIDAVEITIIDFLIINFLNIIITGASKYLFMTVYLALWTNNSQRQNMKCLKIRKYLKLYKRMALTS